MDAVGSFVVRRRRAVLVFWFVVFIIGVAGVGTVTSRLSSTQNLPGLPGFTVSQEVLHTYGTSAFNGDDVLVLHLPASQPAGTASGRADVAAALAPLQRDRSLRVASYLNTGDSHLVADGGRSVLALVFGNNNEPTSYALAARVRAAAPPGTTVAATSGSDLYAGSQHQGLGVLAETLLGGVGALLILALVFGSLLALIPLAVAVVSILTTLLLIGAVTTVASVSNLVEYLVSLIGLGIAIDYSLLVVNRWREERGRGRSNHEAVVAAVGRAGRTAAFSGVTVGVGLLTLIALPIPFLRSLGYAGILIPLVSVAVANTLLPALLATVGPRLEWPRRRRTPSGRPSRAWAGWARTIVRHRAPVALAALALLGVLAVAATGIRAGVPRLGSLSTSGPAATGLATLERDGFPAGAIDPIEVLVKGGPPPAAVAGQLGRLPGASTAITAPGPAWQRDGTSLVEVVPVTSTTNPANTALIRAVSSRMAVMSPKSAITGEGPVELQVLHAFYGRFPLILALVAAISMLVLGFAFRSVVLALKALVLNGLSIGATVGVLVLVWQHGFGSRLIWGVPTTGAVVDFVPLVMFAFLFGLSMDYEVFIVSRMREARDEGRSTDDAVVAGVAHTSRLVTSAAAVLVLAFAALAASPQLSLKMFAAAVAAGILLDATIVRGLLLPAAVSLLGERAWWWPGVGRRPALAAEHVPVGAVPAGSAGRGAGRGFRGRQPL